ncbi:HDIG domain-containing protein [Candidatus Ozemobacteraceae bacterium]|nr:HDIG domain-containing protein [Candidatus Ozemobacteraceae bacterium]
MGTSAGITREKALELLRQHVKNENMIRHCLASEAVLKALARRLGEDEDLWGLAGLLHDLDVEITNADLAVHGLKSVELLAQAGVSPEIIDAVRMHNERAHGETRSKRFHHALAAGETITGLVTATALVYPDKKVGSVKPSSIVKRMKEKAFAASVDRDIIRECEKIGVPLNDFAALAVEAMQSIAPDLGL